MTDIHFAAPPTATPLANLLACEKPQSHNSVYCGMSTPYEFDARDAEIAALFHGVTVHDLGWSRRVEVRGEDRFRWLSGMVTNTVNDLAPNGGAWNLVLNAQGRIQGDLTVWRDGDRLELEISANQYERLLEHLEHFIIMDDVELSPLPADAAIGVTGPRASALLQGLNLPPLTEPLTHAKAEWNGTAIQVRRGYGVLVEHYELWVAGGNLGKLWQSLREAGAKPVGVGALDALRIAEAVPLYGVDIVERDLAQETSQMRGLHFNKGCYMGQEIVERIRSRGNVHRHLRSLELEGALPDSGAELLADGAAAGHITSAAELPVEGGVRRFALGMLRAEAEVRNQPLTYTVRQETGTARILTEHPKI